MAFFKNSNPKVSLSRPPIFPIAAIIICSACASPRILSQSCFYRVLSVKTKRFRLPPREALSQDLDIEGEGLSESSRVFDIDPLQSETITTKPNTNLGKPNSGKKSWIIQIAI